MDAKALAKSKRAHSLHHSKKHHPSKTSSKGSVTATTSSKKPDSKCEKQKSTQSQGSKRLPSNWDRYEDDEYYDTSSEDVARSSVGQAPDVVLPRSKGADYAHLISEAKAQSQSSSYLVNSFTLYSDILDEFNQGLGPLLFSRGHHLASSSLNDNFLLDDEETSSNEASFLSLNLHSLAEQLEKISLAERIFIEPDLLPQELCIESQENTGREPNESQTASDGSEAIEVVSDRLCSRAVSPEKLKVHKSSDYVMTDSGKSICNSVPTSTSEGFLDNDADSLWEIDETNKSTAGNFTSDFTSDKPLRFDAGIAEAELDSLLDSLGETKLFDSSSRDQHSDTPYVSLGLSNQFSRSVKDSQEMVAANIDDDDIDNLLSETSDVINKKRTSPLQETKTTAGASSSTSAVSNSNNKVFNDFDSWLDTI